MLSGSNKQGVEKLIGIVVLTIGCLLLGYQFFRLIEFVITQLLPANTAPIRQYYSNESFNNHQISPFGLYLKSFVLTLAYIVLAVLLIKEHKWAWYLANVLYIYNYVAWLRNAFSYNFGSPETYSVIQSRMVITGIFLALIYSLLWAPSIRRFFGVVFR